jgi:hypothetical protein
MQYLMSEDYNYMHVTNWNPVMEMKKVQPIVFDKEYVSDLILGMTTEELAESNKLTNSTTKRLARLHNLIDLEGNRL